MSVQDWRRARRILCVRLDGAGDVLMTTPALRALRDSERGRHVTLLTSSAGAAAARLVPVVDDVVVYDAPWMKATPPRASSAVDHALVADLRERRFDAAVVFTVFSQDPLPAALLCHLADVPLRAAHARDKPYGLLTDWTPDPEPAGGIRHEVRRQLDLVAGLGATTTDERLALAVPDGARAEVDALLEGLGLDDDGWLAVHPGATAPSRRYPEELFGDALRRLARRRGVRAVVTGSEAERDLAERVRAGAGPGAVSVAGALDLAGLAALLERAPLLVSNNTGPVHVAAAVGTPVVDLYALTNPQHTPWGVPARVLSHDVPCRWCHSSVCVAVHHDCLRKVAPADVAAAAEELLDARRAERAPAGA
ncbi:MAG TPA: glycosyltransferase family 9 protein [Actinomycetota bacterium]|nr:glycosyltransferase family 9 protein [Actinomycetota bacterium]